MPARAEKRYKLRGRCIDVRLSPVPRTTVARVSTSSSLAKFASEESRSRTPTPPASARLAPTPMDDAKPKIGFSGLGAQGMSIRTPGVALWRQRVDAELTAAATFASSWKPPKPDKAVDKTAYDEAWQARMALVGEIRDSQGHSPHARRCNYVL